LKSGNAARSLLEAVDGDAEAALATLDAAWRLYDSSRRHPALLRQFLAMSATNRHLAALRRIDGVPPSWVARLSENDFRASFAASLEVEGWRAWRCARDPAALLARMTPPAEFGPGNRPPTVVYWAAWPAYRAWGMDVPEYWRRLVLARADVPPCLDVPVEVETRAREARTFGSPFIPTGPPEGSVTTRADEAAIHLELTRKVLALRAARGASPDGRTWPPALPGLADSACPTHGWVYSVSPDGRMTLAWDDPNPWTAASGPTIPLRHEEGP
jgi:hypothetical protein